MKPLYRVGGGEAKMEGAAKLRTLRGVLGGGRGQRIKTSIEEVESFVWLSMGKCFTNLGQPGGWKFANQKIVSQLFMAQKKNNCKKFSHKAWSEILKFVLCFFFPARCVSSKKWLSVLHPQKFMARTCILKITSPKSWSLAGKKSLNWEQNFYLLHIGGQSFCQVIFCRGGRADKWDQVRCFVFYFVKWYR